MPEIKVRSDINGLVFQILGEVGSAIEQDDPIMMLESMKMEQPVMAPKSGTITQILVKEEQEVSEGDILAIIEV